MYFAILGLWAYPLVTGILVLVLLTLIFTINWMIDMKKTREILDNDTFHRYKAELPKLKRDLTFDELKKYDGCHSETEYRILTAIDGLIFDVTKRWDLFGPNRPYSRLAGTDSSRSLINFQNDLTPEGYDSLSDLSVREVENLEEWKRQYVETYPIVGRLLRHGKQRKYEYSDSDTV